MSSGKKANAGYTENDLWKLAEEGFPPIVPFGNCERMAGNSQGVT
jgi:hypothetical protein